MKIQATLDKTYFGYVALFQEPNTDDQNFQSFINWGDGSKGTSGHIHGRGGGRYAVLSQHRYVRPGVYKVTVHIRDSLRRKIGVTSLVHVG
jgi:hypothetical protein